VQRSPEARAEPPSCGQVQLSTLGARLAAPEFDWPYRGIAERRPATYELLYGVPDVDLFPVRTWRRLVSRAAGTASIDAFVYAPPEGLAPLRQAIARWMGRARGVACDPERIVITAGFQQAAQLAVRLLAGPGGAVLVEDPQYLGTRAAVLGEGARAVPVPVDPGGIDPARIEAGDARLAILTPAHQFPTGAVLSDPRRRELVAWARDTGSWILEDDYDGVFRWAGPPVPPLFALAPDRVLYAGTFSKTMFPSLRLGWVALPEALVAPFRAARWLGDLGAPVLVQQAAAAFVAGGHLERHLRRARPRYDRRRQALVAALERRPGLRVAGADGGLHVVVWLPDLAPDELPAVIARARAAGVGLYPIDPYYLGPAPMAGLVLGYGLVDADGMEDAIGRMAGALG
jgi:GntR family transcriptional regulator/MocR family aminotransferase